MLVSWKIKRWPKLDSEPRCSITTRRPSHASSSSARISVRGCWCGCTAKTFPSITLLIRMNPPWRNTAITGIDAFDSCAHVAVVARVFKPSPLAQRSIAATPTGTDPHSLRTFSTSVSMPRKRNESNRVKSPGSMSVVVSLCRHLLFRAENTPDASSEPLIGSVFTP